MNPDDLLHEAAKIIEEQRTTAVIKHDLTPEQTQQIVIAWIEKALVAFAKSDGGGYEVKIRGEADGNGLLIHVKGKRSLTQWFRT
jgi:hypothetical protein